MKHTIARIAAAALSCALAASLSGCLGLNFFGSSAQEKSKPTDEQLCKNKKDVYIGRTFVDSLEACRRLSEKGDIKAEYVLGMLYADESVLTSFLDKNTRVAEGISHIRNAADSGLPEAQYALGEYYSENGNDDLALKYLSMAAENGNKEALTSLAMVYEQQGKCKEASEYYMREAAATGNASKSWLYLFLLNQSGCGNLKADPLVACGYLNATLNRTAAKTALLQTIEWEKNAGKSEAKDSVTTAVEKSAAYTKANKGACEKKAAHLAAGIAAKYGQSSAPASEETSAKDGKESDESDK